MGFSRIFAVFTLYSAYPILYHTVLFCICIGGNGTLLGIWIQSYEPTFIYEIENWGTFGVMIRFYERAQEVYLISLSQPTLYIEWFKSKISIRSFCVIDLACYSLRGQLTKSRLKTLLEGWVYIYE